MTKARGEKKEKKKKKGKRISLVMTGSGTQDIGYEYAWSGLVLPSKDYVCHPAALPTNVDGKIWD